MSSFLLAIISSNVPDQIEHKVRADEIKELPKFLTVDMKTIGDLELVLQGANIPSADQAGVPWIKTNSNGSPVGLFILFNGNYVNAIPNSIAAQDENGNTIKNPLIQTGEITVEIDDVGKTLRGVVHTFATEYLSPPNVVHSVIEDTELPNPSELRTFLTATKKELKLDFNNDPNQPRTIKIAWQAIGPIAAVLG